MMEVCHLYSNGNIRYFDSLLLAGEMAECTIQLVLEPYLVLLKDVRSSSHYVCSLKIFFNSFAIVFRVVFTIVRFFNTFDIIDICVLCV